MSERFDDIGGPDPLEMLFVVWLVVLASLAMYSLRAIRRFRTWVTG